ncbi:hypothetical protein GCM10022416_54840 [Actinomadura keratinilytica]|uniref:Uncharacterized protein n=2 Tax=Actinomadura keratinilytica TaxID=547461 RepID=A0ABP7ZEC5_9ACTN
MSASRPPARPHIVVSITYCLVRATLRGNRTLLPIWVDRGERGTMTAQGGAADHGEPPEAEFRAALIRGLQEQFPGVRVWYGEATGSWWAMVALRSGPRLLEAPTPQQLREAILSALSIG